MVAHKAEIPTLDTHAGALLGVTQSFSGKKWVQRPYEDHVAMALAQRFGVSEISGRLLAARDVTLESAQSFLEGTLRDDLPDPSCLRDMDEAAARIAGAVRSGEQITIFGDYDVDGATSAACLLRFIRAVGGAADSYIPDRVKEGYGPKPEAMEVIASRGTKLLITVDCGITAHEALEVAKQAGLDVIVLDHHKADFELPPAVAVVNPNRQDDTSGLGYLAAVGVVFLTLVAVQRALRAAGHFSNGPKEFPLTSVLDLVALGTVADVVPLIDVNRLFVRQGLKVMAKRANIGLRALGDVAGLDDRPDSGHLGFLFGPRVNAGGRVGEADLGTELLSTENPARAQEIAALLDSYNQERRALEAQVTDLAIKAVGDPGDKPVIVVAGEGWHPGVIGIVASRLKDRFSRPCIVIGLEEDVGKGSGRSIPGVDLGNAVIDASRLGLLEAGGGHAMAAGLTIARDKVPGFEAHLTQLLAACVKGAWVDATLSVDSLVSLGGATPQLIEECNAAGPFGVGNPGPRFALADVKIDKIDIVGADHIRMFVSDAERSRLKVMAFRAAETPLGAALLSSQGRRMHFVGRLKRDDWGQTPKAEMHLEDAAWA
jgi:single-stranded-DNA-specific exonuclease